MVQHIRQPKPVAFLAFKENLAKMKEKLGPLEVGQGPEVSE